MWRVERNEPKCPITITLLGQDASEVQSDDLKRELGEDDRWLKTALVTQLEGVPGMEHARSIASEINRVGTGRPLRPNPARFDGLTPGLCTMVFHRVKTQVSSHPSTGQGDMLTGGRRPSVSTMSWDSSLSSRAPRRQDSMVSFFGPAGPELQYSNLTWMILMSFSCLGCCP